MVVIVAVHNVVLLAILQNCRHMLEGCKVQVLRRLSYLQLLVVVLGFGSLTSCGWCSCDGGQISRIDKKCKLAGMLYTRYKLVGIIRVAVEYMNISRTGVNV